MEEPHCPNYNDCLLVQTTSIVADPQKKRFFLYTYCLHGAEAYGLCKRFITKNTLNFCPDFVLPDSPLSPSQIIDEFDRLSEESH